MAQDQGSEQSTYKQTSCKHFLQRTSLQPESESSLLRINQPQNHFTSFLATNTSQGEAVATHSYTMFSLTTYLNTGMSKLSFASRNGINKKDKQTRQANLNHNKQYSQKQKQETDHTRWTTRHFKMSAHLQQQCEESKGNFNSDMKRLSTTVWQ